MDKTKFLELAGIYGYDEAGGVSALEFAWVVLDAWGEALRQQEPHQFTHIRIIQEGCSGVLRMQNDLEEILEE